MAMDKTYADYEKATLGAFPNPLTIMDLLNLYFAGDVQKYGYGYAVIKNWGQPGDTVTAAMRRKFLAVPTNTVTPG
jgi:hypothetical protein